ncbi:hypothetical protein BaRGS_00006079 [Batillaria attramentaria]|uniref:Uncharacterized protein n=1 Tax=Batillaria attramentaria TaxID=370345 RepID=A0ABD0LTD4_9CAEN
MIRSFTTEWMPRLELSDRQRERKREETETAHTAKSWLPGIPRDNSRRKSIGVLIGPRNCLTPRNQICRHGNPFCRWRENQRPETASCGTFLAMEGHGMVFPSNGILIRLEELRNYRCFGGVIETQGSFTPSALGCHSEMVRIELCKPCGDYNSIVVEKRDLLLSGKLLVRQRTARRGCGILSQ